MVSESAQAGASSREPGPDEVYCRDCGSIIKERAEICPECGVRQRSAFLSNVDESGVAAVASLLIPGAGQIFLGHLERGLLFIAATFVAAFMSMFLVGIPVLLVIWVYAIYDAYRLGEDPTRARRVWGGDTDATPVTDTARSRESDTVHSRDTETARSREPDSTRPREAPQSGPTESETDVTGDLDIPEDTDTTTEGDKTRHD